MVKDNRILYFFSLSSIFYLAKITSFSPIYIIYPLIIVISLYYILINGYILKSSAVLSFIIIAIISVSTFNVICFSYKYSAYVNLILAMLAVLILINLRGFNFQSLLNTLIKSLNLIIVLLLLDTVVRFFFPDYSRFDNIEGMQDSFYAYKFSTYMFSDSNTVALICLPLIFLLRYLYYEYNIKFRYQQIFLEIILFSCLSRSAIFSYVICVFIFTKKINKNIKIIVLTFIIPIAIYGLYDFSLSDGSGESKFLIIHRFIDYLHNTDYLNIFFGSGFDRSEEMLHGIYGHIFFVTTIVEFGFFGLFLFLIFYSYIIIKTQWKALYIIIPVFISGLSYYFYLGSPFLILPIIYLYILEKLKENND